MTNKTTSSSPSDTRSPVIKQARKEIQRLIDRLLYTQKWRAAYPSEVEADRNAVFKSVDALLASVVQPYEEQLARLKTGLETSNESTRLAMLREANWNQMYHDQRERAERAEAAFAALSPPGTPDEQE